ncbi:hypothetical protein Kim5_CH01240 [Rhizobium sp. Kim5]|nr:hypothetical protein Kim5_CH01240 [Rhizobium sp. Kim5]
MWVAARCTSKFGKPASRRPRPARREGNGVRSRAICNHAGAIKCGFGATLAKRPYHPPSSQALSLGSMPGPHRTGVDPRVKPWDDGARGGLCGKPARQSLRRAHTIKERYRRNRRHHL